MKNEKINMIKKNFRFLIVVCSLLFIFGCPDLLVLVDDTVNNNDEDGVFVRIYIGEDNTNARTIQPGHDSIAGYRLTFTDGIHEPVDITASNSTEVYLNNGNWTITATAYRQDGVIGNDYDAIADGSITITISGGNVQGTIPPIILSSIGSGDGTLRYSLTLESGHGTFTLWQIDGQNKVSNFGNNNGELFFLSPESGDFLLPTGRYIAEAKITNLQGNIAFRRDIIEIWQNTVSFFEGPTVYVDPSVLMPNSGAALCETNSTINGIPIGSGSWYGGGWSEVYPRTYTVTAITPWPVSFPHTAEFKLEFETDSLFATIGWNANTGEFPNGEYFTGEIPTDFTDNNVLWIRVISEDGDTFRYYRFDITPQPPSPPGNGFFINKDTNSGFIGGIIR